MRLYTLAAGAALVVACAHPASINGSAANAPRKYTPSSGGSRELLPDQQVQQVLNRLAFGPRPGDAIKVRAMGVDRWIEQQLNPAAINDRAAEMLVAQYTALGVKTEDLVAADRQRQQLQRQVQQQRAAAGDTAAARQEIRRDMAQMQAMQAPDVPPPQQVNQQIQVAKVARAVVSERQLYEVMVDFWANHFSVFAGKGQVRNYLLEYDRDVIRPRAMGKFRDLLGAVAHSSAMLFYLDNSQSQADSLHPTLGQLRGGRGGAPLPARGAAVGLGRGANIPVALRAVCTGESAAQLPPRVAQLPPETRKLLATSTPDECARMVAPLVGQRPAAGPGGAAPRRGLNENYARELMELHTLGVDGGYSQKDVIEVARALTGWTIAQGQGGEFIFRPEFHDATEKVVLEHTLAARRGIEDGEEVLDILARHPATAKYITTKLARRFIADDPPASVVDKCSKVFTATDGDIQQTLGCVVTSEEFFSKAAYRSKVKTPFEVVASGYRALNAVPDTRPGAAQPVAQLGQQIYGRQTPDGWPDRAEAWMNTGAILNRINFGITLAGGRVPGVTMGRVVELDNLRALSREEQVEGVVKLFFGGEVSKETREILLNGENPLLSRLTADGSAAGDAMNGMADAGRGRGGRQGQVRPGLAGVPPLGGGRGRGAPPPPARPVELQGLAQVVGLALGAPEFQRR